MPISSRTPEGEPLECPICGEVAALAVSDAGDSICPACGQFLWEVRDAANRLGMLFGTVDQELLDRDFELDSLEVVELAMSLEDRLGGEWREEEWREIRSLRELLRRLRKRRRGA